MAAEADEHDLPLWLVLEVVALLRAHRYDALLPKHRHRIYTAVTAAAELLNALDITPSDNGVAQRHR